MRSGRLRERIVIQQRDDAVAASGTPSGGWVEFGSMRADVIEKASTEKYEADQNTVALTHEVRIRYLSGVTRDMRVVWLGRVLNIQGFTVDRKRREIVMQCEERAL